jgi:hypothetical protein
MEDYILPGTVSNYFGTDEDYADWVNYDYDPDLGVSDDNWALGTLECD